MPSQASVVLIAALVAALVGIIGHVLSRINAKTQAEIARETARLNAKLTANVKLAEMRQAWLNALRDEMASLLAMAVAKNSAGPPSQDYSRAGSKIELLMNPGDQDYAALKSAMGRFLGLDHDNQFGSANDEFVQVSQRILKREWEVLKKQIEHVVDFSEQPLFHRKVS